MPEVPTFQSVLASLNEKLSDAVSLAVNAEDQIPTKDSVMDELEMPSSSAISVDGDDLINKRDIAQAIADEFDVDTTIRDAVEAVDITVDTDDLVDNIIEEVRDSIDLPSDLGYQAGEHIVNLKSLLDEIAGDIARLGEMRPATDNGDEAPAEPSITVGALSGTLPPSILGHVRAVVPAEDLKLVLIAIPRGEHILDGKAVTIQALEG